MNGIDLTIIWAGIIAFAVVVYVIMDGFDLGILSARLRDHIARSLCPADRHVTGAGAARRRL